MQCVHFKHRNTPLAARSIVSSVQHDSRIFISALGPLLNIVVYRSNVNSRSQRPSKFNERTHVYLSDAGVPNAMNECVCIYV